MLHRFGLWFAGALASATLGSAQAAQFLTLPPSAFAASNNAFAYTMTIYELRGTDASATPSFAAPVLLPDGATITAVRVVYAASMSNPSVIVRLMRVAHDNSSQTVLANLVTPNSGGTTLDATGLNAVVNNEVDKYQVELQWTGPQTFGLVEIRAVRITYDAPSAQATCPGDINGDSQVDGADLSVILAQFGNTCTP